MRAELRTAPTLLSAISVFALLTAGCAVGAHTPSAPPQASTPQMVESAPLPSPEPPPLPELGLPAVDVVTLPSGMNVWHVKTQTLPMVHIRLVVGAGAGSESMGAAEPTALTLAHRTTTERESWMSDMGSRAARPTVRVLPDATIFSVDGASDVGGDAITALGAMVSSSPSQERPHAARPRPLPGRAEWHLLLRELYRSAVPASQKALWPNEAATTIPGPEQVEQFHRRHYGASNMTLVVVGTMERAAVVQAAESAFATRPADGVAAKAADPGRAPGQQPRVVVAQYSPGETTTVILVGALGPSASSSEWPALWAARELVQSTSVTRGCDAASTRSFEQRQTGRRAAPFVLCLEAAADQGVATIDRTFARMQQLAHDGPTDLELSYARRAIVQAMQSRIDSMSKLADELSQMVALGVPATSLSGLTDELHAVTPQQVRSAVQRLLTDEGRVIVVATDEHGLPERLTRYGQVEVVDPVARFRSVRTLPWAGR